MEFKMPDIGEGVAEGEVVKWLVNEGDTVVADQPLVEVMTDKATVVIPSPTSGVVQKIYVNEGTSAKVGQALVVFSGQGGPAVASPKPAEATPPKPAATTQSKPAATTPPEPVAVAHVPASRDVAATKVPAVRAQGENGRPAATPPSGRVLAAPATRKMAREAGVDLSRVSATGPHGRVTREDLTVYIERGAGRAEAAPRREAVEARTRPAEPRGRDGAPARPAPSPVSFPEGPRPETRVPIRGIRKRIAENMRRSKDHAAHFTFVEECDMTEMVKLREISESVAQSHGVKLSYLPFIVKAVVAGLKEFPYLNSVYDEEKQEIVVKGYYNIGIAAATDEGLTVPVVKDCDRKTVLEIASEMMRLSDEARRMQLRLEDMQGSTFTITSLGALGGILATPIIHHPEVAILGVHRIRKRPVVRDDAIVIRDICYLSCSFDHRIIDGHIGAQFVMRVVQLLEEPRLLLLGA